MKKLMKNDNYKIYIITHTGNITPHKYFDDNDHYEILDISNDPFHRILSEFIGMRHIYQSKKKKPQYIGFCHFHRFILDTAISDDVFDKDAIQIFHRYSLSYYNNVPDKFKHLRKWFCYYDSLLLPEFMIEDIDEYLKSQKTFKYEHIIDTINSDRFQPIGFKEIYFCSYIKFKKIYKFVNDYIKFIEHKYDLNIFSDWRQHIIDKVMPHYFEIPYFNYLLYQSRANYELMYRNDYGFYSSRCNQWRVYAYMLEYLVILFCCVDQNYCETLVNDECDRYLNAYDYISDHNSIYVDIPDYDTHIFGEMLKRCNVALTYSDNQNIVDDRYNHVIINNESKDIYKSKLFNIINYGLLADHGHIIIKKNKNIDRHLTLYKEALIHLYHIEQTEENEHIIIKFDRQ